MTEHLEEEKEKFSVVTDNVVECSEIKGEKQGGGGGCKTYR